MLLPFDFTECERGNIWLLGNDATDHMAYLRITADVWLEVSIRCDNYPGLYASIVRISDEALAAHIREHFGGWYARKMGIEGVVVAEDGEVQGDEDDDDE